jgi:hypothetical protein
MYKSKKSYLKNSNHFEGNPERMIKLVFRGIIPIVFLISGIALLGLRISGWGTILGIPLVVFGSVFLIYTYDEVVSKHVESIAPKLTTTPCSVCGKPTPKVNILSPEDTICDDCKVKIKKGITG